MVATRLVSLRSALLLASWVAIGAGAGGCVGTADLLCEQDVECRRTAVVPIEVVFAQDVASLSEDLVPGQSGVFDVLAQLQPQPASWQTSLVRRSSNRGGARDGRERYGITLTPGGSWKFMMPLSVPTYVCGEALFFRDSRWGNGVIPLASKQCVSIPSDLAVRGQVDAAAYIDEVLPPVRPSELGATSTFGPIWPEEVRIVVDTLGPTGVLSDERSLFVPLRLTAP